MRRKSPKKAVIKAHNAYQDSSESLPEQVLKNMEMISHHQHLHRKSTTTDRRILEKIAAIFGHPKFLYFLIIFFIIWIGCSNLAHQGILPKNFPLFDLHLHGLEIASLLISIEVLIYQTRQEKLSEERSHLTLQFNLLTEQKIAKLISLVEELRTDLPNVHNRDDDEAEVMKQATDPHAVLGVLQNRSSYLPNKPLDAETYE
jgi:uncharacterized membrane protein